MEMLEISDCVLDHLIRFLVEKMVILYVTNKSKSLRPAQPPVWNASRAPSEEKSGRAVSLFTHRHLVIAFQMCQDLRTAITPHCNRYTFMVGGGLDEDWVACDGVRSEKGSMYIHTYTYIHTHTHTHVHTYIYTYIHIYVHTLHIRTYVFTYIHT